MSSGDAEPWARLRLVQGDSAAQVWELVASAGQTTLTVGASPGCNWIVRETGVAPTHFSLHWDGAILRIADTFGAGNASVDGQPVTAQWRPISGRARIDFGKAAIVVEASAAGPSDASHPLEPASARAGSSAAPAGPQGVNVRQPLKSTLIGVSPLAAAKVPPAGPQVAPAAPAQAEPTPGGSFRPKRPGDTQRPQKATLVGMSSSAPPPAATPAPPAPAPSKPAASETRPQPASSSPVAGRTLMGIGLHDRLVPPPAPPAHRPAVATPPPSRVGGASLADGDQRTIQGFPTGSSTSAPPAPPATHGTGRRVTQQGVVSESPGVSPGSVSRAPVRSVAAPTSQPDPRGSTWNELASVPEAPRSGPPVVPQAVMLGQDAQPGSAAQTPRPPRNFGSDPAPSGRPERFSDAPALQSTRPRRQFPWAYVGIAALTAVAYFAWLYLLDHL